VALNLNGSPSGAIKACCGASTLRAGQKTASYAVRCSRERSTRRRLDRPLLRADREDLPARGDRRRALWTPRVWPGGLLLGGEIAGTWRRADTALTVQPWRPLSRAERDAVTAEAESLPLPGARKKIVVRWDD
jgi:hypothetical protein